jgi:hypothetical protein
MGLRRFIDEMVEEWDGVRFEVDEIRDAGEQMVGFGRMRARGRASGVDLEATGRRPDRARSAAAARR